MKSPEKEQRRQRKRIRAGIHNENKSEIVVQKKRQRDKVQRVVWYIKYFSVISFSSPCAVYRNRLVQLQHRKSYQIGISSAKACASALVDVINKQHGLWPKDKTNMRPKHCSFRKCYKSKCALLPALVAAETYLCERSFCFRNYRK